MLVRKSRKLVTVPAKGVLGECSRCDRYDTVGDTKTVLLRHAADWARGPGRQQENRGWGNGEMNFASPWFVILCSANSR